MSDKDELIDNWHKLQMVADRRRARHRQRVLAEAHRALNAVIEAREATWQRLTAENRELYRDIEELRHRYGLTPPQMEDLFRRHGFITPHTEKLLRKDGEIRLNTVSYLECVWAQAKERGEDYGTFRRRFEGRLRRDVRRLAEKHGLADVLGGRSRLFNLITEAWDHDDGESSVFPVYPEAGRDGPLVQWDNPIIQDELLWEKQYATLEDDPPPQPRQIEGSREGDWRPLHEWHRRHPEFSVTMIAALLHRNRVSVERHLLEFRRDT